MTSTPIYLDDKRILGYEPLIAPDLLKHEIPVSELRSFRPTEPHPPVSAELSLTDSTRLPFLSSCPRLLG